jgi:hypothetical protein
VQALIWSIKITTKDQQIRPIFYAFRSQKKGRRSLFRRLHSLDCGFAHTTFLRICAKIK